MKTNNKYKPALIIGLGGTGVSCLRLLKSVIHENLDHDLKLLSSQNKVRFVGIDTDKNSNSGIEEIDLNLVESAYSDQHRVEEIPKHLVEIDETWVLLQREAVNHAVEVLSRSNQIPSEQVSNFPLKTAQKWFPKPQDNDGDSITLGHSKLAGAAQWRPLGRLSLFINASRIYNVIQSEITRIRQSTPSGGQVDCYIVCSLAGGTGSGIFWDIALMIQMILPGTRTIGMFLLGDPFENVDEAGRIYPNVYASLKELFYYKNLKENLNVEYPIGNGKIFDSTITPNQPYDTVFLYQSFFPGAKVVDRNSATILYTNWRIAQNLLAHMRKDLHKNLDIGANNAGLDTAALHSQQEKGFCFSSSCSTTFQPLDFNDIESYFINQLKKDLSKSLGDLFDQSKVEPDFLSFNGLIEINQWTEEFKRKLINQPIHSEVLGSISNAISCLSHHTVPRNYIYAAMENLETPLLKSLSECQKMFDKNNNEFYIDLAFLSKKALDEFLVFVKNKTEQIYKITENHLETPALPSQKTIDTFQSLLDKIPSHNQAHQEKIDDIGLTIKTPSYAKPFLLLASSKNVILDIEETSNRLNYKDEISQNLFMKWSNIISSTDINQAELGIVSFFIENLGKDIEGRVGEILPSISNQMEQVLATELLKMSTHLNNIIGAAMKRANRYSKIIMARDNARMLLKMAAHPDEYPKKLNSFLAVLIPSDDDIKKGWHFERARHLITVIGAYLDTAFIDTNYNIEKLNYGLQELKIWFEELTTRMKNSSIYSIGRYDPIVLVDFLKKCTNMPVFCDHAEVVEKLDHDNVLNALIDQLEDIPKKFEMIEGLTESIIGELKKHSNHAIAFAGGEPEFKEHLYRCRTNVFMGGVRENKANQRHAVLIPFGRDMIEHEKEAMATSYRKMCQEVYHVVPNVVINSTSAPMIYFEDLARSADEIVRIKDYFRSYQYDHAKRKGLFHVFPQVAQLPEIIYEPPSTFVGCGNHECSYNIRDLARDVRLCPGCNNPIWNRCGNLNCLYDDMRERLTKHSAGSCGSKNYVPTHCPFCKHFLENWWWRCDILEHTRLIPADKVSCITCVDQIHDHPGRQIVVRQGSRDFHCHGCLNRPGNCCPDVLPQSLQPYYRFGVNGHDSAYFPELIAAGRKRGLAISEHFCQKNSHTHILFPTCPLSVISKTHHHLYLDEKGRWTCTYHPQHVFFPCDVCEYPISKEHYNGACPRCLNKVSMCDYCGETKPAFRVPLSTYSPVRCSHCLNFTKCTLPPFVYPGVDRDLKMPAFCSNMFDCKAGAHSHLAHTEFELKACRVCEEDSLVPTEWHANDFCPLCTFFRNANSAQGDCDQRSLIRPEDLKKEIHFLIGKGMTTCEVCKVKVEDLNDWTNGRSSLVYDLDWSLGIHTLYQMTRERDNQRVADFLIYRRRDSKDLEKIGFLQNLFADGSLNRRTVRRRLLDIVSCVNSHFQKRNSTTRGDTQSTTQKPPSPEDGLAPPQ